MVASSDAENSAFISDYCTTEFRNAEGVVEGDLVGNHFVDVIKVDRLAAPLEIVHELVRGVALLKDERVVQQLVEFFYDVNLLIVRNFAAQFAKLAHFKNEVFLHLVQL